MGDNNIPEKTLISDLISDDFDGSKLEKILLHENHNQIIKKLLSTITGLLTSSKSHQNHLPILLYLSRSETAKKHNKRDLSACWMSFFECQLSPYTIISALEHLKSTIFPVVMNPLLLVNFLVRAVGHSSSEASLTTSCTEKVIAVFALDALLFLCAQHKFDFDVFSHLPSNISRFSIESPAFSSLLVLLHDCLLSENIDLKTKKASLFKVIDALPFLSVERLDSLMKLLLYARLGNKAVDRTFEQLPENKKRIFCTLQSHFLVSVAQNATLILSVSLTRDNVGDIHFNRSSSDFWKQ